MFRKLKLWLVNYNITRWGATRIDTTGRYSYQDYETFERMKAYRERLVRGENV